MKTLILGKGIANDGVKLLLEQEKIEYDYLNPNEVKSLDYDYVIKAPGIPYSDKLIQKILEHQLKIITDIELAMMFSDRYFICVTGSNGKTTTVSLIESMLSQRYNVVACGNIGYSVCRAVVECKNAEIFVVECSSFQLERSQIDPHISVLLNASPCHLDHHSSFRDYLESKRNITLNQSSNHILVYNYNDRQIKRLTRESNAKKITFSTESCLTQCYRTQDHIYFNGKKILKINSNLRDKDFLLADVMAAISTVLQVQGMCPHYIRKAMKHFKEVEYRLTKLNDFVYNDAKSTNPYSTIAAIKCFDSVLLLCGGYDRKENLNCLNEYLGKIKRVYAYGETKDKIYNYMTNHNVECFCFTSLEEAFYQAILERKDEVILFSPMFASFDSFKNYIERGTYFNELYSKYFE